MSLTIRPVDPSDEREMAVLHGQYLEAQRAEVPDARVFSQKESETMLRRPEGPAFYDAFAAFDGDPAPERMLGQAWATGSTTDNLHQAYLWAWVPPRHSRQGVGTALVQHAEEHLRRQRGRRTAVTVTWLGKDGLSGYRAFAERLGYVLNLVEVERRQPLPFDESTLRALEEEAAEHGAGYRLHRIVGPVPTELAQGFCDVHNQLLVEMPQGDLEVEEGRRTPVDLAAQDEEILESGRTRVTVLALHETGAIVAYTCAVTSPADRDEKSVDQWSTLVVTAHRGHRLGLAIKCALTRTLQEQFPDRTFVRTQNAEVNAPMVRINELLGFEIHSIDGEFQHQLA